MSEAKIVNIDDYRPEGANQIQPPLSSHESQFVDTWAEVYAAYNVGNDAAANTMLPELARLSAVVRDQGRLDQLDRLAKKIAKKSQGERQ